MDDLLTAEDIERLAKDRGLTLVDLCKQAGCAHTTFYRWRKGEQEPGLGLYRRLRDVATGRAPSADQTAASEAA